MNLARCKKIHFGGFLWCTVVHFNNVSLHLKGTEKFSKL